MTPEHWERIKAAFHGALALPAERRPGLLDQACAGDPEGRAEVERLLLHHDAGATPAPLSAPDARQVPRLPFLRASDRIGSYRVLSVLGEGGMGVVYLAEQEKPTRTVALKVIKPGLASPAMLRRFEHEAQVLGRLQHPGIAQIFEAGTANAGSGPQPYFAMEYVRGVPLTDYAAARRLGTRQRLELFAGVCDAVQHAHAKGVIHRDLKPANILVDAHVGGGQPKILDFGIARAIDADIHATTAPLGAGTDVGQLVGTIPYMSPEQAAGRIDDIDTRSDIYSLGVILYELLAERLPYDISRKLIHEAVRVVRETQPARLSSVNRLLRGDIETIVQTALRKEAWRRYQTAADLAADIRRYLDSEPILARPATLRYSVAKFAGRHRGLVGGILAVIIVLALGLAGTAWELVRASQAEELTRRTNQAMWLSLQGRHAEAEAMLRDELAARRRIFPANHPQIVATLMNLAAVLLSEGDEERAEEAGREALGLLGTSKRQRLDERRVAHDFLAALLLRRGKLDDAETLCRQRLAQLEGFKLGQSLDAAAAHRGLGEVRRGRADLAGARGTLYEALRITEAQRGPEDAQTADVLQELALVLHEAGDRPTAEAMLRRALAIRQARPGEDHQATLSAAASLALVLAARGQCDEAHRLAAGVDDAIGAAPAPAHPPAPAIVAALVSVYEQCGTPEAADRWRRHLTPSATTR